MNAPAERAATVPSLWHLAPKTLAVSHTHIQALRRSRYDVKALEELTDSVARIGVLQPIVARHRQALAGEPEYEIVAGERRWLAAQRAKLDAVPVIVRPLTDTEVLELQLTENLQREDLHPLEEAEGYEELMQLKGCRAEDIAAQIGKGRSYVFQRIKLLALSAPVREAFYAGKVSASIAYDIATIAVPELQAQALEEIIDAPNDYSMSYREAHEFIVRNYRLALKSAPFDVADATLVAAAGPCGACPKRTGTQPELFGDVKSPDVCTDPKCFGKKRDAAQERKRAEAKKAGQRVVTGKAAKDVFRYDWGERPSAGFVRAEDICEVDPEGRSYAKLLGDELPAPMLVERPKDGALVEIYERKALTPLLRAKGIKREAAATPFGRKRDAKDPDAERNEEIERELLVRGFTALHHKLGGKLGLAELRVIAVDGITGADIPDCLDRLFESSYGKQTFGFSDSEAIAKLIAKLTADQLGTLIFELALARDVGYARIECTPLVREACKRHGVDLAAIRKDIEAGMAAPKADAKAKPAAKTPKTLAAKKPKKRSAKK